jgi:8-oxo-dGTP diphosphatase
MSDQRVFCASKALIVTEGRFLAIKQLVNDKVFWDLPGGKIEFGESAEQTLHREVKEEVPLEVTVVSTLGTFHFFREKDGHQVICITFICTPKGREVDITKNPGEDGITDYRWVTKEEFLGDDVPVSAQSTIKDLIARWNP